MCTKFLVFLLLADRYLDPEASSKDVCEPENSTGGEWLIGKE